jgi:CheY-like chemotaxis protein
MSRILIIEDSSQVRRLTREVLEADGHTILEAEDGLKGLKSVAAEAPECILLDLIMPDIDGLKILKILRQQGSKIPVIVITAHVRETIRKQCLAFGAAAFIGKPPIEAELRNAVKKVLA